MLCFEESASVSSSQNPSNSSSLNTSNGLGIGGLGIDPPSCSGQWENSARKPRLRAVRAALGGSASVRAFAVAQPLAGAAFGVAVPEAGPEAWVAGVGGGVGGGGGLGAGVGLLPFQTGPEQFYAISQTLLETMPNPLRSSSVAPHSARAQVEVVVTIDAKAGTGPWAFATLAKPNGEFVDKPPLKLWQRQ